jgi:hypothetical protein
MSNFWATRLPKPGCDNQKPVCRNQIARYV